MVLFWVSFREIDWPESFRPGGKLYASQQTFVTAKLKMSWFNISSHIQTRDTMKQDNL